MVQVEDHLLHHVTPAPPKNRLCNRGQQGMVQLEDHLSRQVTAALPHHQVLTLEGGSKKNEIHSHGSVLCSKPTN